uniref:Uncharacterized protein n=1 Tax=Oryza sativa subsp. japonica TaxID=39947 RepID=Q75I19_ORYSJ|nr:hypothetical protein [Oryza sativa Japonica Group]
MNMSSRMLDVVGEVVLFLVVKLFDVIIEPAMNGCSTTTSRRILHTAQSYSGEGSHNDINVLQHSPLFARLAEGQAPQVNYEINGHNYTMGYYLADRIYPSWATFVKTISEPQGNKKKHFAQQQEAAHKDVERAFGVLQARFAIVRGPARFWYAHQLKEIMIACIILHNMIVEDEKDDEGLDYNYDDEGERVTPLHTPIAELQDFIQNHHNIRNRQTHSQLQEDLVDHLWQFHGRN